jgi:hypothetical protein
MGMVTRPGRELSKARGQQFMPKCLLADRHTGCNPQRLGQIENITKHNPLDGENGLCLNGLLERAMMTIIENGLRLQSLARH